MTTATTTATNLTEFAQLLKDNGFTVIVSKRGYESWMYFFKDGKFGSVSKDRLSGYDFTTVHKPCRECGTGYRMTDNFADLNIENANKALLFAPSWATSSDRKAIRKYTSIEEFINSTHNKWAEYYTL